MKFLSALKKKKEPRDFYLSLIFKPHKAAAILFEKTQESLVIISTKEEPLTTELDTLSSDDLVKVADTVISSVEGALPEGESVEKTIFSVPYSWQTDGKITRENLTKLKQICDALDLKAIGFIISAEAIVNFLHKKDGAPVSAIFVEHAANNAIVYLVKGGKILEVHSAPVGEDFVGAVEKLLTQVEKVDNLPAKIVLHDYEGVESLQQEFLNHEWKKELNFLQIPQVLVLDKGFENEAVIHGVASQMGFDVLQDLHAGAQVVDEETDEISEVPEEIEVASADEFGFVQGEIPSEDPLDTSEEGVPEEETVSDDTETIADEEVDSSVKISDEHRNVAEPTINEFSRHDDESEVTEEDNKKDVPEEDPDKPVLPTNNEAPDTRTTLVDKLRTLPILSLMDSVKSGKGISSLFKKGLNLRIGLIAFGIVALLVAGTYLYYNYFLKAEIIIFADSTVVTKDESVVFSSDDDTSFEDKTIKLGTLTESIDVTAEQDVTGKKETGEKAKGEITVYNKTEKPVTFEKGTEISANNLDYVLLDDIKIASTSSFSTSFSSSKAKVEATKFGKEYNLPSGTNFTVDGQSTSNYFAKNDSAFAGGTKTELTVVSKADLESLRKEVQKGSQEKALAAAKQKLDENTLLINTPLSSKLDGEKFSKKEGEEAKKVSVSGKLAYTFGTYSKQDLADFVEQMGDGEVPDDYGYREDQSDIQVTNIKVEDKEVTGKVSVNAVFAPTIETSKILGELAGKNVGSAEDVIRGKKGISDYTILRKNVLPLFPSFLPFNAKNISITVKTDG